jgi:enoyl-CoA hydratase
MTIDLGSEFLQTSLVGGVFTVVVNRPERRNAYTMDMYRGLKRAAIHADSNADIDVMVVTGTEQWFGAGGDMAGSSGAASGLDQEWDPTDQFPFRHFELCRKVIVAKINGVCQAGGLNLVMYADVSVASDQATFRVPELLRGAPDPWMAGRLAAHIGMARAKYLYFTAARFDAEEAERIGLVGLVVPHAELNQRTSDVVASIQACGPASRASIKSDLNRQLPVPDAAMFKRSIRSAEMTEGMAAFVEKRDPTWPQIT